MKKPYIQIRMPVCNCGRKTIYFNVRKLVNTYYKNEYWARQNQLHCVVCTECNHAFQAGTKRAAVQKFEYANEVLLIEKAARESENHD